MALKPVAIAGLSAARVDLLNAAATARTTIGRLPAAATAAEAGWLAQLLS